MSGSRMIYDGLWRCLCPSVDQRAASRVLNAPLSRSLSILSRRPTRQTPTIDVRRQPCRQFAGSARAMDRKDPPSKDGLIQALLHSMPKTPNDKWLDQVATDDLFAILQAIHNRPGSFQRVAAITKYLIQSRGAEPSPKLYECLIACARDPTASADMVSQLLAEMKQLKLPTGSLLFHDVLEALAVHPDYILRNEILWAMKQSWTTLEPRGEAAVALGLLRDGQYELAFDKAEEILNSTAHPFPWLFDIFIFVFARQGFLDEAVRLANAKLTTTRGTPVPSALWHLLLDECARAHHYPGAKYIWSQLLDRSRISDGTLVHLMNTAARNADPKFAADAMDVLSSRGARLGPHHYEAIIDGCAAAGDIPSALRALCIMHRALSAVPEQSTRTIYTALVARPDLLTGALEALSVLQKGYDTPIEAANVLIEATVATRGFSAAFGIYTSLSMYTRARSNVVTLTHLMKSCDFAAALMTLVSSNSKAALKANPEVFERAISEFALAGQLTEAYKCVRMLREAKLWVTRDTALTIVRCSLDAKDSSVWRFLKECKFRKMYLGKELSMSELSMSEMSKTDAVEGEERSRRAVTKGKRTVMDDGGETL